MKNNNLLFIAFALCAVFTCSAMEQKPVLDLERDFTQSELCRALWSVGKYQITEIDYGDQLFNNFTLPDPSIKDGALYIEAMALFGNNNTVLLLNHLHQGLHSQQRNFTHNVHELIHNAMMGQRRVVEPIYGEILLINLVDRTLYNSSKVGSSNIKLEHLKNLDIGHLKKEDLMYVGLYSPNKNMFINDLILLGIDAKNQKKYEDNFPAKIFFSNKMQKQTALTLCGCTSKYVTRFLDQAPKEHLYDCATVIGEHGCIKIPMPAKRHIAHMAFNSDETQLAVILEGGTLMVIKPLKRTIPGNYLHDAHFAFTSGEKS